MKNKDFTIFLILYKKCALVLGLSFEKSWKFFPPFNKVRSCGRHGHTANIFSGMSGTQRGQKPSGWPLPEHSAFWIHGLQGWGVTRSLWCHLWLLHHHHTDAGKALRDWPRRQSQRWIQHAFSNISKQCWTYKEKMAVLVSAWTELTFFLVAGTVLCFGFSVRMMLITRWCFSCC